MRKVGTIRDMTREEIIEARSPTKPSWPDPFLVMGWGLFIGLTMFLVSAALYPCLGVPPVWLIVPPLAAFGYGLIRS